MREVRKRPVRACVRLGEGEWYKGMPRGPHILEAYPMGLFYCGVGVSDGG